MGALYQECITLVRLLILLVVVHIAVVNMDLFGIALSFGIGPCRLSVK
jgi:hypothetical protein